MLLIVDSKVWGNAKGVLETILYVDFRYFAGGCGQFAKLSWQWIFWLFIPFLFIALIFAITSLENVGEITKPHVDGQGCIY